jgi:hypothetical protein
MPMLRLIARATRKNTALVRHRTAMAGKLPIATAMKITAILPGTTMTVARLTQALAPRAISMITVMGRVPAAVAHSVTRHFF